MIRPCLQVLASAIGLVMLTGCATMDSVLPSRDKPAERQASIPVEIETCALSITSDVDGVEVLVGGEQVWLSQAGMTHEAQVPCGEQIVRLAKDCYSDQRLIVDVGTTGEIHVEKAPWEKFGYLRVQNTSNADTLEIGNLPGDPISVPPEEHVVHQLPLGSYVADVGAQFKLGVKRRFQLCSEDEIYSLTVDAGASDLDMSATAEQEITLEHGRGRVRVVTVESNVEFQLRPVRTPALERYIKSKRIRDVLTVPVEKIPEQLKAPIELLRRLTDERFKAPDCVSLSAGQYTLTHSLQEKAEPLPIAVQPNGETRISLPGGEISLRPIPDEQLGGDDLCR